MFIEWFWFFKLVFFKVLGNSVINNFEINVLIINYISDKIVLYIR